MNRSGSAVTTRKLTIYFTGLSWSKFAGDLAVVENFRRWEEKIVVMVLHVDEKNLIGWIEILGRKSWRYGGMVAMFLGIWDKRKFLVVGFCGIGRFCGEEVFCFRWGRKWGYIPEKYVGNGKATHPIPPEESLTTRQRNSPMEPSSKSSTCSM